MSGLTTNDDRLQSRSELLDQTIKAAINKRIYAYRCEICNAVMPIDYDPMFCCTGQECGCMGMPTNPCLCSSRCFDAAFKGIGKTMEERRINAGIERITPPTPPTQTPEQTDK